MSNELAVHGFETSNNIKVRVALGYKAILYVFHTIDPRDREEVVRISGQYLTPVLVHGERVLCDSAAILRYLECNFPDTPKLFGDSLAEQWEIEDWEMFARTTLAASSRLSPGCRGRETCSASNSACPDRSRRYASKTRKRSIRWCTTELGIPCALNLRMKSSRCRTRTVKSQYACLRSGSHRRSRSPRT